MLPGDGRLPLSIASPPERSPELLLHYRSTPGDDDARKMDELVDAGDLLEFEGPFGDVILATGDDRPLVLVSGGTGAGQAIGLATAQAIRHPERPVLHLACMDHEDDVYFRDLLPSANAYRSVVITDSNRRESNRGLAWLRGNGPLIDQDHKSWIVISGGPAFVFAVTDVLKALGIPPERITSDVYAFA